MISARGVDLRSKGFSGRYRSSSTRATVAIACWAVTGVLALLSGLHMLAGFDLTRRITVRAVSLVEATEFDELSATLGLWSALVSSLALVALLAWLSRSVDNSPVLTGKMPSVSPRWSIGWWFVPVANLYKPYDILREQFELLVGSHTKLTWLVLAWWLSMLLSAFAQIWQAMISPTEVDHLYTWFAVGLWSDGPALVAAVLAIVMIRRAESLASRQAGAVESDDPTTTSAVDRDVRPAYGETE